MAKKQPAHSTAVAATETVPAAPAVAPFVGSTATFARPAMSGDLAAVVAEAKKQKVKTTISLRDYTDYAAVDEATRGHEPAINITIKPGLKTRCLWRVSSQGRFGGQ